MMQIYNKTIFDAVTIGSDQTSSSVLVDQLVHGCIQAVWTGTPAGNIILQASCDDESPTNWTAVETKAAGGAADSHLFNMANIGYRWVRLFYDFTSSTGTIDARASFKG